MCEFRDEARRRAQVGSLPAHIEIDYSTALPRRLTGRGALPWAPTVTATFGAVMSWKVADPRAPEVQHQSRGRPHIAGAPRQHVHMQRSLESAGQQGGVP